MVIVVASLVAMPSELLAQPAAAATSTGADPQVPFIEGRALVRAERFAEAAEKFEASLAIRPTVGAWLNLGACHEKLGHYASAVAAFEGALKTAAAGDPRATEATKRAAQLRPLVSTLTVRVAAKMEGARVLVDGKPAAAGVALPVDGGDHEVSVSAPCHKTFETRVSVGLRGNAQELALALQPSDEPACAPATRSPGAEAPSPPRPLQPASPPSTWGPRHSLAVIAGAGGIVALGVGTVFGILAADKKSELDAACNPYPTGCPPARKTELTDLYRSADGSARVSTAAFVTGAVFVVAAAALYVTAPSSKTSTATATSSLRITTTGAAIAF
jgi:hypothetical protein